MTYDKATSVAFLSVASFEKIINAITMRVVHNANNEKLSVLVDEDTPSVRFYKVAQKFDPNQDMAFLIPDGDIDKACLVNVKRKASPLTTVVTLK